MHPLSPPHSLHPTPSILRLKVDAEEEVVRVRDLASGLEAALATLTAERDELMVSVGSVRRGGWARWGEGGLWGSIDQRDG